MRTFIAIELEAQIRENIKDIINHLKNKGRFKIRWIKSQGMHLTLKFLGEIAPQAVDDIQAALKNAMAPYTAFPLTVKGTGVFPPKSRRPRILWLGMIPNQELEKIQAAVEQAMEALGFPRETRKFRPHLTLGRVKAYDQIDIVLDELTKLQDEEFGTMRVDKITLFESTLKPSGAEYRNIYTVDLP
jgi:2'-5' RNA ligase